MPFAGRPTSDYDFSFPDDLIATAPSYPPRVLQAANQPKEIAWREFLDLFQEGDILVRNNSKVIPRRIFSGTIEILFIKQIQGCVWEVLFPAKKCKLGDILELPGGVQAKLLQKGLPQQIEVSEALGLPYFFQHGELPLPPYIQAARDNRHHLALDQQWYQTCFAQNEGSLAAPTAGLHFKPHDFELLQAKGVEILDVTLHVGLGTFLPIQTESVEDFQIHAESFEVSEQVYQKLAEAAAQGKKITTLGTTATRVLESLARVATVGTSEKVRNIHNHQGRMFGETQIYLRRPEDFLWTSRILTNFHQPKTSLLVMICAFAGYDQVMTGYQHAIRNKFKLFSYGDFSIWSR